VKKAKEHRLRKILLTDAGDSNPLSISNVALVTELVGRCLQRERFGGPKIDFDARLSELSPEEFARTATRHRVLAFITRHVDIPELWKERLKGFEQQIAIVNLDHLRRCDHLSKEFASAGIPHVFMKGSGLSLIAVGRLGLRDVPTDVDILVKESDTIRATALLSDLGYEPHLGASPEKPRVWEKMLVGYRELAFNKGRLLIDLHWRPADQPELFPPAAELIEKARIVSNGDLAFPTLSLDHALWLESLKMLHDRNFSLSISVTIVLLTEKAGANVAPPTPYLSALVSAAQFFAFRTLGQTSETSEPMEVSSLKKKLDSVHQQNWALFSVMGLMFNSHRTWVSLAPLSEILNRFQTLRFTGRTSTALKILVTHHVVRPLERFDSNLATRFVSRLRLVRRAFKKNS